MADGLFGNIYDAQLQQQLLDQTAAQSYGTGWEAITRASAGAGGMLGRGIGKAFGGVTPMEAKQQALQGVAAQFPDLDPGDPKQLRQVQSALWQAGLYDQATEVGNQANEIYKAQTGRITAERPTGTGTGTEFERWLMGKAQACNGDPVCLAEVQKIYDKKMAGGGESTAKQQNALATARALVAEHGGDVKSAYNYVLMQRTGATAYDLGVGYERFMSGRDADVGVGEAIEEPDFLQVTEKPLTLEEIQSERLRLSNLMTTAPDQDKGAYKEQLDVLGSMEGSTQKSIDRLEKFAKDNVQPISNELKNISDVRTFWSQAVQGNIAAANRLKTSLAKLGGDNRVGIQEVQTVLGGGDIIERMKRSVNAIISGDLTQKDADDVKRIIEALDTKYSEKMRGVIDRGRGAYRGVAAEQYLDAYLPRASGKQDQHGFVVGQIYSDAQGNRAEYLGNGEWGEFQ